MRKLIRGAVAVLLGTVGVLALTLPASAEVVDPSPSPSASAPSDDPTTPSDDPTPGTHIVGCEAEESGEPLPSYTQVECSLEIAYHAPICDNDVPYLAYELHALGTTNDTATITFVNPSGPSVVYTDQPLSGAVLWPGAVVGPDGRGIDWPGWHQASDGTWVEGDEFDWVRPSVVVKFQVNPEASVTVAYPPSSPTCLTSPPGGQVLAEELPGTGANAATPLLTAGALLAMGGVFLLIRALGRRNRTEA